MSSYYLIRGSDPRGTDRIELEGEMTVGRSEDCDVRVQEGHPSRRHATLTVSGDGLWVEDLGSANGTFVNDRQITDRTVLHDGDRVAFDLSAFVVCAPVAADSDATVVRSAPADDATVVRPAPSADPATPEQPQAPDSPQAPVSPQPPDSLQAPAPAPAPPPTAAPAEGRSDVPKSWADPEFQAEGTRVLSGEELKAMAAGGGPAPGAPSDVEGPHLVILSGNSAGSVLPLDADAREWTVGGHADRDLRLHDDGISAFHAKINHSDGSWRVIDQMSANGTWVNGDRVNVSYLASGDRIRFGQVECEIQLPAGSGIRPAGSGSTARTWMIAAAAAVATVAVLALVAWLA